jgi:hypothetical protein
MYIYTCNTHAHAQYIYIYIFGCMHRTSPPRGRTYTQGPAQASACTCAHARARIGGAAAHNGPRCIEARPSASAIVRAAGPGAAHTAAMFDTDAVFHAPMFALNAFAE